MRTLLTRAAPRRTARRLSRDRPVCSARPDQLPDRTVSWLAGHAHTPARTVVRSVWDKLAELERAGHHPDPIAALRSMLTAHQPTSAGRCRTCRRSTWRRGWRRRAFPCTVWHQARCQLLGVLANSEHQPPTA
ncbi:MAG: hypothetical protein ACRDRQ_13695 [Pseudonocardiaceae bacterium]